jgi:hypothetical protein
LVRLSATTEVSKESIAPKRDKVNAVKYRGELQKLNSETESIGFLETHQEFAEWMCSLSKPIAIHRNY